MTTTVNPTTIPQHIAIIMDGNGRWAAEQGKPRSYGHQAGVETVRRITSECTRLGVKWLTLYTFSTENWNRPADEVAALMGLVLSSLEDEIFMKNNVRFQVIGNKVYLNIHLRMRPRVSTINYVGLKKSERTDMEEKLGLLKGAQITPNMIDRAKILAKKYFDDKGFKNADIQIRERDDVANKNQVILDVHILFIVVCCCCCFNPFSF
jgi:undecaprenyl diphosphate synthase